MLEFIETGKPWAGGRINGVRYPRSIEKLWTAEQLAEIGLQVRVVAPPVIPTAQLISEAKLKVVAYADSLADIITGPVPKAEKESWTKKEVAARKYVADPGSLSSDELALLQNELDVTAALDNDLATLSAKIIVQADYFSAIAGKIAGIRRVTMAALDALPDTATQEQVDAVLAAAITQAETAFVEMTGKPSGLV